MSDQVPEDLQRRAHAWSVAGAYLTSERVARLRAMNRRHRSQPSQ